MGVSYNGGTPKWMVYKGKSHLEMDVLGVPLFPGNHHIFLEAPLSSLLGGDALPHNFGALRGRGDQSVHILRTGRNLGEFMWGFPARHGGNP